MKKILLVAHWDWVLHNFRLPLARALRAHGCSVVLVSPKGSYTPRFTTEGFPWIEWRINRRSVAPLEELRAIRRLIAIYRSARPDVVHHFTIKPNLYGSLAARWARVPIVFNTFTGLGFVFSGGASRDPRANLLRLTLGPLLQWAFNRAGMWTICQNKSDRDFLVRRRLARPFTVRVIPGSGVDPRRFRPRSGKGSTGIEQSPDPVPVVLFAGRLLRDKGVAEFVQAAKLLRGRGVKARFWIAGEADPGNPASLPESCLEEWRREGAAEFLGHRADMPELLRQAEIAVLPSYHEGVPRFLLEAAATGLPLVASDIPGCREVVREGVNGHLVPPRDPVALADAIERLLNDGELRARLGDASRRIAVDEFSEEKIIGAYLALYRELGVIPEAALSTSSGV